MQIKRVKMKISKNKTKCFLLMSQWSFNPKIRFLGQKAFRVSGFFPSTSLQAVEYWYFENHKTAIPIRYINTYEKNLSSTSSMI